MKHGKYGVAKFANLYTFLLREEKVTTFQLKLYQVGLDKLSKVVTFSSRNTNVYKFANFARPYFPCFTTFRHQTWQFY